MSDERDTTRRAVDDFIAELRHWREVAGFSQKALARQVAYDASYISKVENGSVVPSREFAEKADIALHAGRALVRRWLAMQEAGLVSSPRAHEAAPSVDDPQTAPGSALVVEHEDSTLTFDDGVFRTRVRRQISNVGTAPISRYLIRIAVDRYPGDPERSNRLYRQDPLTWEEIQLCARCGNEPMTWQAMYDRDAFKEVWLQFENADGIFPLYPGQTAWIEYEYKVQAHKWGPWWRRAIRLPTRRLSLTVDLPAELQPTVWGLYTSMTAEAAPFRTPFTREQHDGRTVYRWSTDNPPLHSRFRVEWKFRVPVTIEDEADLETMPSAKMRSIGIVQEGDPILAEPAEPFDLPREAEDARRVVSQLIGTMERVAQTHTFTKGMGLAANQIGISRAAALVRTPDGDLITLLNPRVIAAGAAETEYYEGCLSFFDVRGMVPRPEALEVEHQETDGRTVITEFSGEIARLVAHEVDHLHGILYRTRMRPGAQPIPVSQYTGTGKRWGSATNAD